MNIPPVWKLVAGRFPNRSGQEFLLQVWGFGENEAAAQREGATRLERLAARLLSGKLPDKWYDYTDRPVREEVVQAFEAPGGSESGNHVAVVTRNGYGALILNTARMLFLDIDFQPSLLGSLKGLFTKASPEEQRLQALRHALEAQGHSTFRIYRTAAGYRVICIGREYDPAGREAADLMRATGTDRFFMRLCQAQKCFRARLTPKPWRCGLGRPAFRFPYRTPEEEVEIRKWIEVYEEESAGYATCQFLTSLGSATPEGDQQLLLDLHDQITGANSGRPLA